jgi:hypothetical protein
MKTLELDSPNELIELAKLEPVVVHSAGRSFAVCEVDEADIEVMALNQSPQFWAILEKSRQRAEKEGWLTTEQLKASLGLE